VAIHGAAHQQPMVFQVITDRPTRPARAGRVRIEFYMSRQVETAPVVEVQTETGSMRVSTPETTAYDLVRFAPAAGRLSNVATTSRRISRRGWRSAVSAGSAGAGPSRTPGRSRIGGGGWLRMRWWRSSHERARIECVHETARLHGHLRSRGL